MQPRTIFARLSVPLRSRKVTLVTQCKEPLAIIEMMMTRARAQALASRINERIYKGHRLNAWVPLLNDEQESESPGTHPMTLDREPRYPS